MLPRLIMGAQNVEHFYTFPTNKLTNTKACINVMSHYDVL